MYLIGNSYLNRRLILGVNLAEFEFPAYFNFFVNKRKCTLIVDSMNAEQSIRTVFGETL